MSNLIYDEPTRDEIIQELEEASQKFFGCDLVTFIRKLEDKAFVEDENIIIDDMKSWLRLLPTNDNIFKQAHGQLSAA